MPKLFYGTNAASYVMPAFRRESTVHCPSKIATTRRCLPVAAKQRSLAVTRVTRKVKSPRHSDGSYFLWYRRTSRVRRVVASLVIQGIQLPLRPMTNDRPVLPKQGSRQPDTGFGKAVMPLGVQLLKLHLTINLGVQVVEEDQLAKAESRTLLGRTLRQDQIAPLQGILSLTRRKLSWAKRLTGSRKFTVPWPKWRTHLFAVDIRPERKRHRSRMRCSYSKQLATMSLDRPTLWFP
ncbi:hypothetical protein BDW71DRAFT_100457 [Aspergillus fruticulosus]